MKHHLEILGWRSVLFRSSTWLSFGYLQHVFGVYISREYLVFFCKNPSSGVKRLPENFSCHLREKRENLALIREC